MDWRTTSTLMFAALALAGCGDTREPLADTDADTGTAASGTDTDPSPTTGPDESDTGESADTGETGETSCLDAPGPWDAGWTIPGPPDVGGDPDAGEWALLNEDYVSCGIPYDLFMLGKGLLGTYADGESFPWREGKNADLPYNWNLVVSEGGTELAAMNCLTCHAGEFNGELVIGLGRHDADFTQDLGALMSVLPPLPEWTDAAVEINKFIGRYDALGPYIRTYTVGTNPALNVAVILASHRNPYTLEWSDEQLIPMDPPLAPVDPPPWWRVKKKAGHFYNGMSRGDHRGTMMFASSLCTDSAAQASDALDYFSDIVAYLETLEPPAWPWAVDAALAAEGQELFECNCAGCHGTYDEDPDAETFPNLLIPLELVDTDPLIGESAAGDIGVMIDWYNESWYGTVTQMSATEPFVGYTAPPLDGIWATAPYLHNGSVPTIELVLDSSARPIYWKREDYDSTNYDADALGWPFMELASGQADAPIGQAKYIYDTTIVGHGNGGHRFGDHLSDAERSALLEYLKTI